MGRKISTTIGYGSMRGVLLAVGQGCQLTCSMASSGTVEKRSDIGNINLTKVVSE